MCGHVCRYEYVIDSFLMSDFVAAEAVLLLNHIMLQRSDVVVGLIEVELYLTIDVCVNVCMHVHGLCVWPYVWTFVGNV